mgnify:CR=1 FL=1
MGCETGMPVEDGRVPSSVSFGGRYLPALDVAEGESEDIVGEASDGSELVVEGMAIVSERRRKRGE